MEPEVLSNLSKHYHVNDVNEFLLHVLDWHTRPLTSKILDPFYAFVESAVLAFEELGM